MSIAQWYYQKNNLVFLSFDIGTGKNYCGIVQISAKMFHLMHKPTGKKNEPPTLIWPEETFNKHVNPGENAILDPVRSHIYGLTADSPKIKEADGMGIVWHQFCDWINDHFAKDDVGILVAYTVRLATSNGCGRHKPNTALFHSLLA